MEAWSEMSEMCDWGTAVCWVEDLFNLDFKTPFSFEGDESSVAQLAFTLWDAKYEVVYQALCRKIFRMRILCWMDINMLLLSLFIFVLGKLCLDVTKSLYVSKHNTHVFWKYSEGRLPGFLIFGGGKVVLQ